MPKTFETLTPRGRIRRMRQLAWRALEEYDLPVQRLRFLAQESSLMFRIDTPGEKYVLRIYSEADSSLQESLAETAWLDAIRLETTVNVPAPQRNKAGAFITFASHPGVPGEKRCAVYSWIPGKQLEKSLSPKNYFHLGQVMAQLHDHAEG